MFLLPEKQVSVVISTIVICASATHLWKNFLAYELSKYHAALFWKKEDVTDTPKKFSCIIWGTKM